MNNFDFIIILIPVILLFIFGLALTQLRSKYNWVNKAMNHLSFFYLLIGWSFLGFLFWLDNNKDFGCMLTFNPIFSNDNIIFSAISIGLLCLGYFFPFKTIRLPILFIELIFWLYKLFYIKGGYVVGFGGAPLISVLWFDLIALALRLILIKEISKINYKSFIALFPAAIIIIVKLMFFS